MNDYRKPSAHDQILAFSVYTRERQDSGDLEKIRQTIDGFNDVQPTPVREQSLDPDSILY